MKVRTRFAPSPTGYLHIGGARTALFCWLYARKTGGAFILRIEDTDQARSSQAAVEAILQGMAWLGLDYDEGPYIQSARLERYRAVIDQLLATGQAYHCYCTVEELEALRQAQLQRKEKPRYDRRHRDDTGPPRAGVAPVVRFKNPLTGEVIVDDLVHGPVRFANDELDDLIIARADGTPTYHLTVVVDDLDMGITHVIRGDDHLNNTPRQINLLHALGAAPPRYAHVPMILGADGKRLSKRHGAVSVLQYRDEGFLPDALLNYLVRLGWSSGDQEVFSRAQMIELFDLAGINRAPTVFNPDKLQWLNQHYLKTADVDALIPLIEAQMVRQGVSVKDGPDLKSLWTVQRERAHTLAELVQISRYFYEDLTGYDANAANQHLKARALPVLTELRVRLAALDAWMPQALHQAVVAVSEQQHLKLGKIAQPLRVAVTGRTASPPIDQTLALLGRERTLARIDQALVYIQAQQLPG